MKNAFINFEEFVNESKINEGSMKAKVKYDGKIFKLDFESTGEELSRDGTYNHTELMKATDKKTGIVFTAAGLYDSDDLQEIEDVEVEKDPTGGKGAAKLL